MKVPVLSSLILLLGLSPQLPAIERPKSLDDEQPKARASDRPVQGQEQKQLPGQDGKNEPEAIPQVDQPPGAWLGVLSEPIDKTLSVHLGVKSGVVLSYVAPDSPAAKAGLQQHDIVIEVDGAAVGNQDELRDAIQGHDPGDEVSLAVVSKGEEGKRNVKLGERPVAVPQLPRGGADGGLLEGGVDRPDGLQFENLDDLPGLRGLKDFEGLLPGGEELQKKLEGHMKRLQNQLREMERDGAGGKLPDFELFKDLQKPHKGRAFNFNFKSSSSFKFVDDEGSVEMKTTDGGKEVVVRDPEGKILFDGPWDNKQDKAAAPENIRERVEGMNNGKRFRFRFENLPEPDVEIPEEDKPELE